VGPPRCSPSASRAAPLAAPERQHLVRLAAA
jgi:hypothetical protein